MIFSQAKKIYLVRSLTFLLVGVGIIIYPIQNALAQATGDSDTSENSEAENTFSISASDLVVPNAPASAVIGSQISIKPATTPKAFGISLLNSLSNEEGEFPNNISLEFSPYWWSPKPDLSFDDYYNSNGFGEFILPTLSFSIASEASDEVRVDGEDVDGTKIGLGLRTSLIAGKAHPRVEQVKSELEEEYAKCLNLRQIQFTRLGTIFNKLDGGNNDSINDTDIDNFKETINLLMESENLEQEKFISLQNLLEKTEQLKSADISSRKGGLKDILQNINSEVYNNQFDGDLKSLMTKGIGADSSRVAINKCVEDPNGKIEELDKSLKEFETSRVGHQLESATGAGFDFPDDEFDEIRFRNFATWLTYSYRKVSLVETNGEEIKVASPLEFLLVSRYTLNELEDDSNSFFDAGTGLIYRLRETPLSFSLEYVRRFGEEDDDRFAAVTDYKINDTYSVFLSYGREFDDNFEGNGDVLALFGLRLGFGREPVVNSFFP